MIASEADQYDPVKGACKDLGEAISRLEERLNEIPKKVPVSVKVDGLVTLEWCCISKADGNFHWKIGATIAGEFRQIFEWSTAVRVMVAPSLRKLCRIAREYSKQPSIEQIECATISVDLAIAEFS